MNDLVESLRARYDEDEETARAALPGPWRWADWRARFGTLEQERNTLESSDRGPFPAVAERDSIAERVLGLDEPIDGDSDTRIVASAEHIARHDPARVLREVEAKRQIVERSVLYARDLLCLLALPYADHPAFKEEWKP